MPQRKRGSLAALVITAVLLPGPVLNGVVLGGGVVLGAAGCGDGCFDCCDSGCGCKSGEICSESEQLPASMSPESVHHTVWSCKAEEKKAR